MIETDRLPSLLAGSDGQVDLPLACSGTRGCVEFVTSVAVAALAALECVELAVLLIGAELAILHVNRAAAAILRSGDGLQAVRSKLVCVRAADAAELRRLVESAMSPGSLSSGETVNIRRDSGRRPYSVSVANVALPPTAPMHRWPMAIVYINDPESSQTAPCAEIAKLYGLTAAEARVAEALLGHERLADVAVKLGVSLATVRTLLQRAFDKTDTHRQAELVRLMLVHRLPTAPMADASPPACASRTSPPP